VQRRLQRPPAAAGEFGGDVVAGREFEDLRLFGGFVELVLGQDGGEVAQGSGGGGEGQAVVNGGIEGEAPVDAQPRAPSRRRAGPVTVT
jgi:hypothetical protein